MNLLEWDKANEYLEQALKVISINIIRFMQCVLVSNP